MLLSPVKPDLWSALISELWILLRTVECHVVLTGVKAGALRWPAASLDFGCARRGRAGHRSKIDNGRDCACSGWSKVVVDLPGNGALETSENVLFG
jgi:hypothetical protein